ncbi:hypothetical protein [Rhodococcus sp. NPDC047139]|uniref:hypothetical protein n=1 Tax=Rhodococcus sp. NPDC047139 TaxID=3155141 RepID=UPI0033D8C734
MSAVDWGRLEGDLTEEIVSAVREVTTRPAGSAVYGAALTDTHARDMLFLWPAIRVGTGVPDHAVADRGWDVDSWPVQVDWSSTGDKWAETLTASVGLGDYLWDSVTVRFRESLVSASRRATRALIRSGAVNEAFAVVVHDPDDPVAAMRNSLTVEQLATLFPELYRLAEIEDQLSRLSEPEQVEQLVEMLVHADSREQHRLAHRLLVAAGPMGVSRVVAALGLLPSGAAASGGIDRVLDVLLAIGEVDDQAAERILAFAKVPTTTTEVRARAVSVLSAGGQACRAMNLLADLPENLAGRAVSAPYVDGERRCQLDYAPIREVLAMRPELDEVMAAELTSDRIQDIGHEDLRTAADALDSPSRFIRRHASIVLLSSHL